MEISETKALGDELLNWNDIQKMRYSWKVIREVLRLCPSFPNVREAIHDFDFNGFSISKGWKVSFFFIYIYSKRDNYILNSPIK